VIEALAQSFQWIHGALMVAAGGLLVVLERRWPRRAGQVDLRRRWRTNLGLLGLGLLLMVGVGESVQTAAVRIGALVGGSGLVALALPGALKVLLGVLLADAIQYALHRISHALPLLWQLHQVHHADEQVDVSTSVRHHPLETLALFGLNFMLCAALGVPLLSLMLYALLAVLLSLFCHANLALPSGVDRVLRWFIVTPDMHRVHHSVRMDEGNSNFGMAFPWWDRLCRSYCAQPQAGHGAMELGLPQQRPSGLLRALAMPFMRSSGR
jgi:sterol desaturase/sphingolipid hydroxylase (fatty acid hydroxylase superfamily)